MAELAKWRGKTDELHEKIDGWILIFAAAVVVAALTVGALSAVFLVTRCVKIDVSMEGDTSDN